MTTAAEGRSRGSRSGWPAGSASGAVALPAASSCSSAWQRLPPAGLIKASAGEYHALFRDGTAYPVASRSGRRDGDLLELVADAPDPRAGDPPGDTRFLRMIATIQLFVYPEARGRKPWSGGSILLFLLTRGRGPVSVDHPDRAEPGRPVALTARPAGVAGVWPATQASADGALVPRSCGTRRALTPGPRYLAASGHDAR
jgi:hypothetical protein